MTLLLEILKGALRQKYFMMCFSEYLGNQNHKQMCLFVREMSNYASSSCIHNFQVQRLNFCSSCKHYLDKIVLLRGWGGFLCSNLGWAIPSQVLLGRNRVGISWRDCLLFLKVQGRGWSLRDLNKISLFLKMRTKNLSGSKKVS